MRRFLIVATALASAMGTNIVSGTAVAVVAATGDATCFGAMAKEIIGARPLTSFDKGISKVSWMLIRFLMVMTPLVFLINGLEKGDWLQSLLFAVSVAVGLTPEMLPMIVTTNLAKGAVTMARRKTIVKRLNAIQNFGAMDVLCTDKTGTLTQNKIILERHLDIHGKEDLRVLEYAWLNSNNQTGLKNLLDVAVLEFALQHELVDKLKHYRKIDEIPFDFMGSSDSSIPSVSWLGIKSNFFSASALLVAVLSIVKTPRSMTFRSLGQGFVGSFVGSPATASCALRRNVTGPRFRRSWISSTRKLGGFCAASAADR